MFVKSLIDIYCLLLIRQKGSKWMKKENFKSNIQKVVTHCRFGLSRGVALIMVIPQDNILYHCLKAITCEID